jgi:hypothetical protein
MTGAPHPNGPAASVVPGFVPLPRCQGQPAMPGSRLPLAKLKAF